MTSKIVDRPETRTTGAATVRLRFALLLLGLWSCSTGTTSPAEAPKDAASFDTQTADVADATVLAEAGNVELGGADQGADMQDAILPTVTDAGADGPSTETGISDTSALEVTDAGADGPSTETGMADTGAVEVSDGRAAEDPSEAGVEVGPASFTAWPSMSTPRTHHSATVLSDGKVLIVGGEYGVYSRSKGRVEPVRTNSAELYDPTTDTFAPTGSLPTPRLDHTATLLADGRVLVAGGAVDILPSANAELFDPTTGTFQPTSALLAARAGHTATLLDNGKVFIAGGDTASCELFDPTTGGFSPAGSMASARRGHSATLLASGKVLIVGGTAANLTAGLLTAELYDPVTGTFSKTGAPSTRRDGHSATRLADGRVLIVGGEGDGDTSSDPTYFASAELYDPATGVFAPTGSMFAQRLDHSATLLANGKVLIAGGWYRVSPTSVNYPATAETYDPATGTFTPTGTLVTARAGHPAVSLASGEVLLVGGSGGDNTVETYDPAAGRFHSRALARENHTATRLANGKVLFSAMAPDSTNSPTTANAVLYDPAARVFAATGEMVRARSCHTATLLLNNNVLFAGGRAAGYDVDKAELYDLDSGTFSATATMTPRCGHTATLLSDGRVLVAGGAGGNASAELFDVATASFIARGSMVSGRSNHTATLLPNGKVLLVGGWDSTGATLASAELYDPAAGAFANTGVLATGRIGHTATLLPDGRVLVVGGWSGVSPSTASSGLYVGKPVTTAELYDVSTGSFSPAGSLLAARLYHSATLLPDGKVLIVAGSDQLPPSPTWEPTPLPSSELYDPTTAAFLPGPPLTMPRVGPTATLLTNGEVLVVGGNAAGYHGHETVAQVEVYH